MRYVIALGGNALLQRSDRPDEAVQRRHVRAAAEALAPVIAEHQVVVCHGNGPQVGMLAVESDSDRELTEPFSLDTLGSQTQGMIGYWLSQGLANAGVTKPIAALLTQTIVDAADPAFGRPTKFIGRGYREREAHRLAGARGWRVAADGERWRRVVSSPRPQAIVELPTVLRLLAAGTAVVCAGGGGAPVVRDADGLRGVEAVVDKDLTAALLAEAAGADRLVLLTDVDSVKAGYGTRDETALRRTTVTDLDAMSFPVGSMGPKVEACIRFASRTGRPAHIGALTDAAAVIAGESGTTVLPGPMPSTARQPG